MVSNEGWRRGCLGVNKGFFCFFSPLAEIFGPADQSVATKLDQRFGLVLTTIVEC